MSQSESRDKNSNFKNRIRMSTTRYELKIKQKWIRTNVTDKFEWNWVEFSASISRRIPYVWTSGRIEHFPFALSRPNGKATNSLTFIRDAILQSPFAIGLVLELAKYSLVRRFRQICLSVAVFRFRYLRTDNKLSECHFYIRIKKNVIKALL